MFKFLRPTRSHLWNSRQRFYSRLAWSAKRRFVSFESTVCWEAGFILLFRGITIRNVIFKIVRNACLKEEWGEAETDGEEFPFKRGEKFDLVILNDNIALEVIWPNKFEYLLLYLIDKVPSNEPFFNLFGSLTERN